MPSLPTLSLRTAIPTSCRRAFQWDATAASLGGLFSGAVFPFLGVIARQQMHASGFLLALLSASGSVGNLFNPLVAHHIRARPKLPYVVWPIALARAVFFLMPLAVSAAVFIALASATNFISALSSPAYSAVIRDAYPARRRGWLMGRVRVAAVVAAMVGAPVGGLLLAHHSFRLVFPLLTILGIGAILAFSRIGVTAAPEEGSLPEVRLRDTFAVVRNDRTFKLYCTCFYLYGFGNLITGPIVPIVQVDQLHITTQWVGYLATAGAAASILGYLYWGRVVDRYGPFRLMFMVICVVTLSPVTYFTAHSVPVLLIASCAQGFGFAGGDLGYVNAAMRFGKRESAAAYAGMFAFLQACRGIPAPFVGDLLRHVVGERGVFLVGLGFWLAALVLLHTSGALKLKMEPE